MKIVIVEPLGVSKQILNEIIQNQFSNDEVVIYDTRPKDEVDLIHRLEGAEVLVVANLPISTHVIEATPTLKMISVAFTGVDHLPLETCKKLNITVCNSSGYSTAAVTDLVFGLILNLYRHLATCDQKTRHLETKDGLQYFELEGKTIGIVGVGEIGQKVARVADAFGMKVLGFRRHPQNDSIIKYVDLNTLLQQSDIVSVHLPLNQHTYHLIGKQEIELMKKSAIIINTARGDVIDQVALVEALNNGRIAGAGLDVFTKEPPLNNNDIILTAVNTILTPHIGFATQEALIKRAYIVFENIKKYFEGNPQNIC